jgi:superfamily I DNA/RNA helicase/mRNA-degrading endonuclease RelE of RelBE toxin-antitoxin system
MTNLGSIRIALGDDFLDALGKLPKKQYKKTREFIKKFQDNPTNPGCNYEKIKTARDPNLRSVRIDQAYRGIVLKPETGNLYILLWVDKHDDAYAWATKHVCQVHPKTGAIQVLQVEDVETQETEPHTLPDKTKGGIFDKFDDETLISLGIPSQILPTIRTIRSEEGLDRKAQAIPLEASNALYALAAGIPISEMKAEATNINEVDTTDFAAALDSPDTKQRFIEIDSAVEMEKILAASLDKWRVFLHPSQRRLVEMEAHGPVRVTGGAGTGKTVVAMHRAKWLANHVCKDQEQILFTTFTTNLAADIKANLKQICSVDELERIEVINLDAWVHRFLSKRDYKYRVDFKGNESGTHWEHACEIIPSGVNIDANFLRGEWDYIIQAQGIENVSDYIKASRIGRPQKLERADRKKIWPVFEEYRALLTENGLRESVDVIRDARQIIEDENASLPYRCVIIDEAQDFSAEAFRLIRSITGKESADKRNDIFIVGDAHQRIYGHRVVLPQCGIGFGDRHYKLRVNYRTSEETRAWASAILNDVEFDDLSGGFDDLKGYRSIFRGKPPITEFHQDQESELRTILSHIDNILQDENEQAEGVCIVAPKRRLVARYQSALQQQDCSTVILEAREPDDISKKGIRIATMHRVKGVEFNHVIVAGINNSNLPLTPEDDESCGIDELERNRSLLHVAATRSRGSVLITGFGKMSRLLS